MGRMEKLGKPRLPEEHGPDTKGIRTGAGPGGVYEALDRVLDS